MTWRSRSACVSHVSVIANLAGADVATATSGAVRDAPIRPETIVQRAFGQLLYPQHPYGRYATPEEIIQHGIRHLGAYHVDKPLRYNKAGEIVSDSFNLLFFYHNRLSTYGWENHIQWRKRAMEEVAPGDD